jgi:hypothetical protein
MSFIEMGNVERPVIIVGKPRTGKTTKALEMLEEPAIFYANEFECYAAPTDRDILIEEVDFKANEDEILELLRMRNRIKIVMTSLDKKSIPKKIAAMCRISLAGSQTYGFDIAPRSIPPVNNHPDMFSMIKTYLENTNRDKVAEILKQTRPADTQIMTWLNENLNVNKLVFVDARVKRRWRADLFYEMLAYCHNGKQYGRVQFPKRGKYSQLPYICRRLGLKSNEVYLLKDLLNDESFLKTAKTKLNNVEYRMLGLGEKPRQKRIKRKNKTVTLDKWL